MSPSSDSPPQLHSHNLGRLQFVSNCALHLLKEVMRMAIASRLLVTMTMMTMMTSPAISLDWVGEGIVRELEAKLRDTSQKILSKFAKQS